VEEIFRIFRITVSEADTINASANEPHIHDYEELILGEEGQLEHFIDYKSEIYTAPYVSFIAKGKLHRVRPLVLDGKCLIRVIRFMTDFVPDTSFQLYAAWHDTATVELPPEGAFRHMVSLCDIIQEEWENGQKNMALVRDLLKALLTMTGTELEKKKKNPFGLSSQHVTFGHFLKILEENFRRDTGVEFYAEKLFMTSRNLNLVCQNVFHKSISEIIEDRKMLEAKNLLVNSGKSISEIGFELGFSEKASFSSAFKKKTGKTPSGFRKQMEQIIS
jgi:AraC family transcriptional regulator, transcriptional activator of pobA